MSEVVRLPAHERMTPEQCMAFCAAEAETYAHVLIVAEGHDGQRFLRSSFMRRETALWLAMFAADDARGLIND